MAMNSIVFTINLGMDRSALDLLFKKPLAVFDRPVIDPWLWEVIRESNPDFNADTFSELYYRKWKARMDTYNSAIEGAWNGFCDACRGEAREWSIHPDDEAAADADADFLGNKVIRVVDEIRQREDADRVTVGDLVIHNPVIEDLLMGSDEPWIVTEGRLEIPEFEMLGEIDDIEKRSRIETNNWTCLCPEIFDLSVCNEKQLFYLGQIMGILSKLGFTVYGVVFGGDGEHGLDAPFVGQWARISPVDRSFERFLEHHRGDARFVRAFVRRD